MLVLGGLWLVFAISLPNIVGCVDEVLHFCGGEGLLQQDEAEGIKVDYLWVCQHGDLRWARLFT